MERFSQPPVRAEGRGRVVLPPAGVVGARGRVVACAAGVAGVSGCPVAAAVAGTTATAAAAVAAIAAAAVAASARPWIRAASPALGGGRLRGKRRAWPRAAALVNDEHAQAVRLWLDEFVIGLNFCPWASPARERGAIRIATSAATTAEGVMAELALEAELLHAAGGTRIPEEEEEEEGLVGGRVATTLLVCPHVAAWADFAAFHAFFVWCLDCGFSLTDNFGVKVVPFHPRYALRANLGVKPGDTVLIPGPDGGAARGVVLSEFVGFDEAGEAGLSLRFDDGKESFVRHVALMAARSDGGDGDLEYLASRSPRPVLHLLRCDDLGRAVDEVGGDTSEFLEENCGRARKLGVAGFADLLARWG